MILWSCPEFFLALDPRILCWCLAWDPFPVTLPHIFVLSFWFFWTWMLLNFIQMKLYNEYPCTSYVSTRYYNQDPFSSLDIVHNHLFLHCKNSTVHCSTVKYIYIHSSIDWHLVLFNFSFLKIADDVYIDYFVLFSFISGF